MKVTQELFDNLKPGDIVLLKTEGQLLDTGWKKNEDGYWRLESEVNDSVTPMMIRKLGQLQRVEDVCKHYISYTYFTIGDDYSQYHYTIDMIQEIYPLVRGLEEEPVAEPAPQPVPKFEHLYVSKKSYEQIYKEGYDRGFEDGFRIANLEDYEEDEEEWSFHG